MIKKYKNAKTRKVHETGNPKGFKGLDGDLAADNLDILDAADTLDAIPPFAYLGLHKLKGNRKKQWAIAVNNPWRICFEPEDDGFSDVEICDYHKG